MAYHYEITIGNFTYIPNGIADSNAKAKWDKGDSGIMFRKSLDGAFTLSRSNNEELYDMIMSFTHCTKGFIWVLDKDWTNPPVVVSIFNKRDITYNPDKCQITIKPRYYDLYNIDAFLEKDYNIINDQILAHSIRYRESYQFEFSTCSADSVPFDTLTYDDINFVWLGTGSIPPVKASCTNGGYTFGNTMQQGWTFYSQENFYVGFDPTISKLFDVTTVWFREVKLTSNAVDLTHSIPPPTGGSIFSFEFLEIVNINGVNYNKWVRNVGSLSGDNFLNNASQIHWRLNDYYGNSELRTITRARRFNEILEYFSTLFGCTLSSNFFYNNVNPISGKDLTNIMIAQKSDCIFTAGIEPTDPATLGIITFQKLMAQLWAMFQVTWVIEDGILYIEHINYFRNNFSYITNTTVGLDLTVISPVSLAGSGSYSYEQNLPIREKFSFMEAWNIDFRGTDIEYTNCLTEGNTETYSAELITTDIDPTYLDNEASKDGFCLFHCDESYNVISEIGVLSGISSANAHLSWANLHDAYWKSNRYLDSGIMNNEITTFVTPRRLKNQVPIEFPFCIENFDSVVNDLVRTTMGDGEIVKAEYIFKSGNIKIELSYE